LQEGKLLGSCFGMLPSEALVANDTRNPRRQVGILFKMVPTISTLLQQQSRQVQGRPSDGYPIMFLLQFPQIQETSIGDGHFYNLSLL
jgi:hypothetical protein